MLAVKQAKKSTGLFSESFLSARFKRALINLRHYIFLLFLANSLFWTM